MKYFTVNVVLCLVTVLFVGCHARERLPKTFRIYNIEKCPGEDQNKIRLENVVLTKVLRNKFMLNGSLNVSETVAGELEVTLKQHSEACWSNLALAVSVADIS